MPIEPLALEIQLCGLASSRIDILQRILGWIVDRGARCSTTGELRPVLADRRCSAIAARAQVIEIASAYRTEVRPRIAGCTTKARMCHRNLVFQVGTIEDLVPAESDIGYLQIGSPGAR